jgi:hypothetical protein
MIRYSSPYKQLGIDNDLETQDKASLNLAKKKLLAEIELSNTHSILRGKREMTKDDVLKAFDNITEVENWDYHRLIAKDPILLRFLEESKMERDEKFLTASEYRDVDFINFISPYFSYSYAQLVVLCLEKRQPNRMDNLVYSNAFLAVESDAEEIWSEVEQHLNKKIETLEEMADQVEQGAQFTDTEIVGFHATGMIECLNLLPKGDFDWVRDRYAIALYNFSANTWNKKNHYRAVDMAKHAQMLVLSEYERNLVDERVQFFDVEMEKVNGGSVVTDSGGSGLDGRAIFFLIYVIFQIIRFSGGCH